VKKPNPLLIDLDGVLLDFIGPLCDLLNAPEVLEARWPGGLRTPSQFQNYGMEETLSPHEMKLFHQWMDDGTLAKARRWYPGSRSFLAHVQKTAPVVILTAGGPNDWNKQTKHLIALSSKSLELRFSAPDKKSDVEGLTLIEDRPDTATAWALSQKRFAILIDRPWNRTAAVGPRVLRAKDYAEVRLLLEGLR
jgi:hypothetical protein